jgi:hypothetical protein
MTLTPTQNNSNEILRLSQQQDGAQTISHRLLQKIGEENVWLQEPVTEISQVTLVIIAFSSRLNG